MTPFVLTLTGPSCAGKSTLEAMLRKRGFENVISTTTRPMRAGEVDGKAYHFIGRAHFERLSAEGAFAESVEFNGNSYGVSIEEVERVAATGKPIVIVVEPDGLRQIRRYCKGNKWNVYSVFVNNPADVIAQRFIDRLIEDFKTEGLVALSMRKTYAKRLGVMMGTEANWKFDCSYSMDEYLSRFDESNSEEVVDRLCKIAVVTGAVINT